jgi:hypothetical protein
MFKVTGTLLDLANIITNVIDRAANVSQMLKDDVIRISHIGILPQAEQ